MSIPKGFSTKEREVERINSDHITAQPVREKQIGQDVVAHQFVRVVGTDAVEADSTTTIINLTSHAAKIGDIVRFTSGNLNGQEVRVIRVTANTVEVGEILAEAPAASDTIQILRHKTPIVNDAGQLLISASSATEDSAAVSGDGVTAIASVRQDTLASDTDADGDYQFVKSNANGEVYIADLSARTSLSSIDGKITAVDTTGKATEAKQDAAIVELQDIEADVEAGNALLTTIDADTGAIALSAASIDGKITAVDTGNVTVSSSALPTGASTAANQSTANTALAAIQAAVELLDNAVSGTELQVDVVSSPDTKPGLDIVDQLDTPLLDTSSSNIPASSGSFLEIVSSTAADVKKIQTNDTTGFIIGLYVGAAASETLKAILPLGGGDLELQIPSGTRISLRAMNNAAITTGEITINFLG